MSPDRKGIWGLGRHEREASSFRVTAEGGDIVHRWLSLKQQIANNEMLHVPTLNGDRNLDLATMEVADGTLLVLNTFASYEDQELEYGLHTVMILDGLPTTAGNPLGLEARLSRLFSDREDLRREAERKERRIKSAIERVVENDTLNIEQGEDGLVINFSGSKMTLMSSSRTSLDREAFILQMNKDMKDETKDSFENEYQNHARVIEIIIKSIYEMDGNVTPSKTYEIKPPKNLAGKLDVAEGAVRQRKKVLSASGMIDSDEEIQREIEQKVQLITMPSETFDDIGGNEKAKEELMTIVHALKDPEAYAKWGTRAPQGVLLFGEPGTGKTMLTKALAHEAGVGIYVVELADVLHSLYGRTERLLNAVFEKARQNAPVVILIDELDALAGNRNQSSEVTSRVVTVLLTNLDGLNENPQGIVVVGTTNRVDAIDPALKRPGRLDMLVNVPLPEDAQRAKILDLKMQKAQKTATAAGGRNLFDDSIAKNLDNILKMTKGFSGADIEELVRRSLAIKVREEARGQNTGVVTSDDIMSVISTYETVRKERRMGFSTPPTK